jgi:NAD(P)-dependent dehydrogenase (short-subunit alcohol dehydrogenase family)
VRLSGALISIRSEEAAFRALAGSGANSRFTGPEEAAHAILYLSSEAAAMITGVELLIDAGYVL